MFRRWLTFGLSAEEEDRFRQANFGADIAQARICILLLIAFMVLFAVNDYAFFGLTLPFFGLTALRLGVVLHGLVLFRGLQSMTTYRSYDRAEFAWGLFFAVFTVVISMSRPQAFVGHAITTVLAVFVTLLAVPNSFRNQLVISGVFSGGEILVLAASLRTSPASVTALISVLSASAIAVAVARQVHSCRRREFLAHEEEGRAKAEAERQLVERRRVEKERETAVAFLRLVNESTSRSGLIRAATDFFHRASGCEAVGIRIRQGHDYPYYETRGFPKEFVLLENSLCSRDEAGRPILGGDGNPVLDCMCGNVIRGRFDPSKSFFTARGSFWSNCTTELLASTTEADRQARTRNRCNGEGYESVALVALRSGGERLGLLQLNDRRRDRFTPESIALWERLADYLAVALSKFGAEEAMIESRSRLETLVAAIPYVILEYDADLRPVRANAAALKAAGLTSLDFTRDHAVAKLRFLRIDGGAVRTEELPTSRALAGETVADDLYRITTADGTERIVSAYAAPLYKDGKIDGVVALWHDITELKEAEEELRAKNEELTRLSDAMVGRELRMIELKSEVNALCARAGEPQPYPGDFGQ